MNTFSNSLFTFLFGWARGLIEGLWNAAAEGKFSRFFTWLGDHWLAVALVLCLGGTALDFLIWIIRWRPYLVWRTALRKWTSRLSGQRVDSRRRFSRGYRDGVELTWTEQDTAVQEAAEWDFDDESVFSPPIEEEFLPPAPMEEPLPDDPGPAVPERRRRRREKHISLRKPAWRPRFPISDQEEEGMLDGLPPAVDRQQAFHEPVYPTTPLAAWQTQDGATNGKNA
ncbi:MAG: hypothetical protein IJ662_12895 [Clostridia bacterium]|nr:hypothetical protein [Clostridia bacterium]